MHMPVAQARQHVTALRLDDLCFGADTVGRIRANKGDAPGDDGDIVIRQRLAAVHVHPNAATNDSVSGRAPGGNGDQFEGGIGPRRESSVFHAPIVVSLRSGARGGSAVSPNCITCPRVKQACRACAAPTMWVYGL